jgi:regulation of enolase protein 1 (concanavalin A-like superfamily)
MQIFAARRRNSNWLLLLFVLANWLAAHGQELTLAPVPTKLAWKNKPSAWHIEGKRLTITSGNMTDWFVDPFDGKVSNSAPILMFEPDPDFVLSTKVSVKFRAKWDAGALMIWADDHHWAKLSFELSPENQPTMVTVVTRGLSDDCNSVSIDGKEVFLQVARSGKTYVFYFSTDGRTWKILRTFNLDTDLKQKVGFEAQSPAGDGVEVIFSDIRFSAERIKNIYTGQ